MTSTRFNVGLTDNTRSSSRVLRPPGGGHTDIFGGEPEPTRGRRAGPPQPASQIGQGDHPAPRPTNGTATEQATPQNGNHPPAQDIINEAPEPKSESPRAETFENPRPDKIDSPIEVHEINDNKLIEAKVEPAKVTDAKVEPAKVEPPKRVRVPPGGFSSGLCMSDTSRNIGCDSAMFEEDANPENPEMPATSSVIDDGQFAANIDLRYGGQYLTPEQLPEFCDQLHHLVEVIRNIQSYAKVTGEYPAELEKRLEREARDVSALAAEAKHAQDVVARVRLQRRALRDHATQLREHLTQLNNTEVRELESAVRLSDRKLYKSWETLKDTSDATAFDPLLDEIRNKQAALECLLRLIEMKRASLLKPIVPHPLPPPLPRDNNEECPAGVRRRGARRGRRRRSPRSVPLSSEPSAHAHLPQVTLYIQGSESTGRRSVPLTPLELPSGGSVRDILFFTTNTS